MLTQDSLYPDIFVTFCINIFSILVTKMSRLQELYNVLEGIDTWRKRGEPVTHAFKGLTYDLTYNKCLGLTSGCDNKAVAKKSDSTFIVTEPTDFNNWPAGAIPKVQPGDTYLQKSFKATLTEGINMWLTDNKSSGSEGSPADLIIDIVSLKDSHDDEWFTDGRVAKSPSNPKPTDPSVVRALASLLNDEKTFPQKTVRPVIRFLLGTYDQKAGETPNVWNAMRPVFERLFWENDGSSIIKHPLAVLHVGFYEPNFGSP